MFQGRRLSQLRAKRGGRKLESSHFWGKQSCGAVAFLFTFILELRSSVDTFLHTYAYQRQAQTSKHSRHLSRSLPAPPTW